MEQKVIFLDTAGATTTTLSQGRASWIMQQPIGEMPRAQVALSQFNFTNFFVNISAALANNKFYYSDDAANTTKYTITIPDGSYSLSELNNFIQASILATHGFSIITLNPNYSTNKVAIVFGNVANWYVHFGADSPFTLLGFTNGQDVPATKANTAYYSEYGANDAAFNNIQSIKVSTNLTNDSVSNTNQSAIIYQCQPIVSVGSTQTSEPNNLLWIPSTAFQSKIYEIIVQLLDQNDSPIFMTENFSLTLIVKYDTA